MVASIRVDRRCFEVDEEILIPLLDDVYSTYDELCQINSRTYLGYEELKLYRATYIQYTSLLQFVYSFCNLSVWRFPDGHHELLNLCSGDFVPRDAVNVLPFDD